MIPREHKGYPAQEEKVRKEIKRKKIRP